MKKQCKHRKMYGANYMWCECPNWISPYKPKKKCPLYKKLIYSAIFCAFLATMSLVWAIIK